MKTFDLGPHYEKAMANLETAVGRLTSAAGLLGRAPSFEASGPSVIVSLAERGRVVLLEDGTAVYHPGRYSDRVEVIGGTPGEPCSRCGGTGVEP